MDSTSRKDGPPSHWFSGWDDEDFQSEARLHDRATRLLGGHRAYMRVFGSVETWKGVGKLSVSSMRVLSAIAARGGRESSGLLQENLELTPSHLSHILADLIAHGLVERDVARWDARLRLFRTTVAGTAVATEFDEIVHVELQRRLRHRPARTQERLATLMEEMERLLLEHR